MDSKKKPSAKVIYTPDDEPYLGRELLFHFDQLIRACLEANAEIAPFTHEIKHKTDVQLALFQVIPQAISIALSIRELVRQGYLFGALVLLRPLAERTTVALFLMQNCRYKGRSGAQIWANGWKYNERPSLQTMIDIINKGAFPQATRLYNSLTHGDPDSAMWNTIQLDNGKVGYGVSKIVDNPDLCDRICVETVGWLAAVTGIATKVYVEAKLSQDSQVDS